MRKAESALVWLWLAAGLLAAVHHHTYRHMFADDDIGTMAPERPTPIRVRGVLDEAPARFPPPKPDPLLSLQRTRRQP